MSPATDSMPGLRHFAAADGTPRAALKVALVVGTVLTLINQGDVILSGAMPNSLKVALTYVVPYLVATCGAITAKGEAWRALNR